MFMCMLGWKDGQNEIKALYSHKIVAKGGRGRNCKKLHFIFSANMQAQLIRKEKTCDNLGVCVLNLLP